ncbi:MAG: hypothetical protein JNK16_12335 [Phycisphaerales bacterium]|nr:hypothetical protein [Phycisphaerales bacterium]
MNAKKRNTEPPEESTVIPAIGCGTLGCGGAIAIVGFVIAGTISAIFIVPAIALGGLTVCAVVSILAKLDSQR